MTERVDPKNFWENKILGWEEGRYNLAGKRQSFLEGLANRSSASLRFRLAVTKELLKPFVAGKRIVEIGCGSGLLAKEIIALGAASYVGYDIAEAAIQEARDRVKNDADVDKVEFHVAAVSNLPDLNADIVFSLGLLDWLTDAELDALFAKSGSADYFHAIAEKRSSLSQWIHRAYVHLAYGHKTGAYVPRYYKTEDLHAMIGKYNPAAMHVYRDPRLSFGALVSSLPIDRDEQPR